ncbi:hypothetical protein [Kitasatospora sp. NPDC058190]|uniref:hypothetical protein n=1 Tax=Kitasatospora sp. NPDC058190 TaxID=3346371 RepID=UPI0036DB92F6
MITAKDVSLALVELNRLATDEYGLSLHDLLEAPEHGRELGLEDRLWRIGRILGVLVKEPFSHPPRVITDPQESLTGARRAWDLREKAFDNIENRQRPEYKVLVELIKDPQRRIDLGLGPYPEQALDPEEVCAEVRWAARSMANERGFFRPMALSVGTHLCSDDAARSKVGDSIRLVKAGYLPHAETVIGAEMLSAVNEAATNVPLLGPNPTLTTGFILLIGILGLDGFCTWLNEYVRPRDNPRAET